MDIQKLLSQGNKPSNEPWLSFCYIQVQESASRRGGSGFGKCNITLAKLLAPNRQVEEVLVLLLLVTDLDPRPFANLW